MRLQYTLHIQTSNDDYVMPEELILAVRLRVIQSKQELIIGKSHRASGEKNLKNIYKFMS